MPLPDAVFLGHILGAMNRLSQLLARTDQTTHPEIPWREITGIRHKLVHDYFVVDLGIVWRTATVNVPEVHPLVRAAASTLGVGESPDEPAR
jgi:uncharacterized protein with HEPN domain